MTAGFAELRFARLGFAELRFARSLAFAFAATLHAATPCHTPVVLQPNAKLEDLATHYLGATRYAIAIVLATNERTDEGFDYITKPDDLTAIPRVCIPSKTEARHLAQSWDVYARAVTTARLPRAPDAATNLLTIPPDQPVIAVAWVRRDQADRLKTASGEWLQTAPSETWVTIEPHLQSFCRAFVHDRKADETKLAQRLEQHLGIAPGSSKAYFVRLRLPRPGADVIFRPCADPAVDKANCSAGPPAKAPLKYQQWFYQQYYSSYGQSLIGEFPWTALGYTFDWAPGSASPFQRTGESEFVIYKDAPIQILEVVPTSQYCAPGTP